MAIYKQFDVVTVPFPFTNSGASKKRPAVILSDATTFGVPAGHSICAMITSSKNNSWPLDVAIQDLASAGLPVASLIRLKIFTLDQKFILNTRGHLAKTDRDDLKKSLKLAIPT